MWHSFLVNCKGASNKDSLIKGALDEDKAPRLEMPQMSLFKGPREVLRGPFLKSSLVLNKAAAASLKKDVRLLGLTG